MLKNPAILLLTAGREEFLREALDSISRQVVSPNKLILVNDGPTLSKDLEEVVMRTTSSVEILKTKIVKSGQWKAFRLGLEYLGGEHPFAIMHDDDRLKPNYIKTLAEFGQKQSAWWICSHNLEVFSAEMPERSLILSSDRIPFVLSGVEEVCLRYSKTFMPFPGTCFNVPADEVLKNLREEYMEMADVVLLCECSRVATLFYQPEPILEYRRHGSQVSNRMDHSMEDQLQDYLLQKTQGTSVGAQVGINLERRRAERYFAWAWEKKTFRNYPFKKGFAWPRSLRCLRNRKLKTIQIIFQDLIRESFS
jgi:glycosyltransferase involved in cell wall biosynthesis